MEIRNVSDMEFSIMMAKKLYSMRKDSSYEKRPFTKKNDTELTKNTLKKLREAKNWISKLENRAEKYHSIRELRRNTKKQADSLWKLWDNMNQNIIHIIGCQKEKKVKK